MVCIASCVKLLYCGYMLTESYSVTHSSTYRSLKQMFIVSQTEKISHLKLCN